LTAKVAGNEIVNGCMMACDTKANGRKQHNNQPTTGEAKAGGCGGGDGNCDGSGSGGGG
jgi:hypothetical protein